MFISGIRQGATQPFEKPHKSNMVMLHHILCKIVMLQHVTIEQYQTYKSTFIHTNIYKSQFIKMHYNSHC